MLTLIIVFGFLTIIPFFDIPVAAFFGTVISASGLLAVAGGLLQTATISLAPVYGPSAITYYMAGSALSAVGVSALQVFTAYTSDSIELPSIDSPSWSATICYATSTVLVVLSLVSFHLLATNSSDLKSVDSKDYRDLPISERTRLLEPTFDSPLPVPQKTDSAQSFNDWRFGRNFAIFYAGIVTLVRHFLRPVVVSLI
jgi:hypothetical protein